MNRPFASRPVLTHRVRALAWLALVAFWLLGASAPVRGADVALAWDAVADARVALYEVHYGLESRQYEAAEQTAATTLVVAGLDGGQQYFFAVRACSEGASECSALSEEVSAVTPAPPQAAFAADTRSGTAPLTVHFANESSGEIDQLTWSFGDGASTSLATPTHTYEAPGRYDVTLSALGPGGESIESKVGYIVVSAPAPVAAMSQSVSVGTSPLTVVFTDQSSGAVEQCQWEFGDGTTAAGAQAVHTYSAPGTYDVRLSVTGPGGSDSVLRPGAVSVQAPIVAPTADFAVDQSSGTTPLRVQFANRSTGDVTQWQWDFGDGATSTAQAPAHTYEGAGRYTVSLTATGPGGTDTRVRSDYIVVSAPALIEAGEVEVDDSGLWVALEQSFIEPVVIAKLTSANDTDPVLVRVDSVSPEGFWLQLEEWDYLDGVHALESVSYLVIERGVHALPDGRWLEADLIEVAATNSFVNVSLLAPFAEAPVIVASVNSRNEDDAVALRLRAIDASGFAVGLDEQEANAASHAAETVAYVAIEAGSTTLGEWTLEAGRTPDVITHGDYGLAFDHAFAETPLLLVDMQSSDGGDSATLRARATTAFGTTLWVEEEQSRDSEVNHTTETGGYLALEPVDRAPAPEAALLIEAGEVEVDDRGLWVALEQSFIEPVVIAKLTSANDTDPVVVRVDSVSPEGFWLQLEEWDYLDGVHALESVSYLVIERGVHALPDGRWLQADLIEVAATNSFVNVSLLAPFAEAPVIVASVNSRNEDDAVALRLRAIDASGFAVGLDEQEANAASHAAETVAYVAIEAGSTTLGEWALEAGRTPDAITHGDYGLAFDHAFAETPLLLVDMQSTDGGDSATLRARDVSAFGASLWVEEEQSRDSEIGHTTETGGYLALEWSGATP